MFDNTVDESIMIIKREAMDKDYIIRKCTPSDTRVIYDTINDAAQAYRGIIPADRWHEPYMSVEELSAEIDDGVEFWCYDDLVLGVIGVMGIQDRGEVTLFRHAYVCTKVRRQGFGSTLLARLEELSDKPVLIGTWLAATWAIAFYEKHGYSVLSRRDTERLLREFWTIPPRQIETSVVLAKDYASPAERS